MRTFFTCLLILLICDPEAYSQDTLGIGQLKVSEIDNSIFRRDRFWRGADGAATIDIGNGRLLWLFSDTFIDTKGSGKRSNSTMINNSIAIQEGYEMDEANMTFYYKGTSKKPKSFFELPGDSWFWTGHGIMAKNKLLIFLFEEERTNVGLGFKSVGWYLVIIDNPSDNPLKWNIEYIKGPGPTDVIIGSSAVLKDKHYIYAYGEKESANHDVYLSRFEIDQLLEGNLTEASWWVNNQWVTGLDKGPMHTPLFEGQTEFSVHYQPDLAKYIQIQTYGFGHASIGYRLADQPEGPWSEPVIFFKPDLYDQQEFVYSANSHPELNTDGILITYNINNFDFGKLINNEDIYFPKLISVKFSRNKKCD